MTHICVDNQTIIGSDNGLSPCRYQAIIWTNAGILLIRPLGTNVNEISIGIHAFSFKKIHFKISSGKWQPFCLSLNVLTHNLILRKSIEQVVWALSQHKDIFPGMGISMIKIRWSRDCLIFIMGISILAIKYFYIEMPPLVAIVAAYILVPSHLYQVTAAHLKIVYLSLWVPNLLTSCSVLNILSD